MARPALLLVLLSALLGVGEWLARRPPAWLGEDPLLHPFGQGLPDSVAPAAPELPPVAFPLDPNHADERELQALPGVGPVLAARIIAWREAQGPFTGLEELDAVKGVGPARLEQWGELLRFGAGEPPPGQ